MTDTIDAIAREKHLAVLRDFRAVEYVYMCSADVDRHEYAAKVEALDYAITSLSNQGEGAKPVAWVVTCHTDDCEDFSQLVRDEAFIERMKSHGLVKSVEPLYAHPPSEADRRDADHD